MGDYLSRSDMGDYVTVSYLSEVLPGDLSDYMSESDVTAYLSEVLPDALSDYLSSTDIGTYLSEALLGSAFADAMQNYLSEYGGEVIYNAISQYINA